MSSSSPTGHRPPPVSPAVRQRLQQLFDHGKKAFEKQDTDYAHDMFAQCVAEDPANLVYLQHFRANLARRLGDGKKSSRFGGLGLKLSGARSGIAKGVEKGDWKAAFAAGCEALKQNPIDIPTLLDLADACAAIGATDCRLYYLKWALDLDAKHEQANRKAAAALGEIGQFDQAITCLRRVAELRPTDQEVARTISRLSVEQTIHKGGYDQDLLRKGDATHAVPGAEAVRSLGLDTESNHHPDDTATAAEPAAPAVSREQQLLELLRQHPTEAGHYLDLAELYIAEDRLRDAERVLTKGVAEIPSDDLMLRERLEETRMRRVRQQAEVAARHAAAEPSPETSATAKQLHAKANQVELEVYAARVTRSPQNAGVQFEYGVRLKKMGKFREAIQAFQAARSDQRRLAETQLNLGECFQQIEQYRLAIGSYEAAVAAAPEPNSETHKLARYRAGVLATGLKEYDKAEKHLTELAAIDFGYRDVADRLDKLAQSRNT